LLNRLYLLVEAVFASENFVRIERIFDSSNLMVPRLSDGVNTVSQGQHLASERAAVGQFDLSKLSGGSIQGEKKQQ
jgi:hypothetical protein